MNNDPFNIVGQQGPKPGTPVDVLPEGKDLNEVISNLINSEEIFLFMKGTPDFPQCGFSANTIGILNSLGKNYKTFDILTSPEVRQGVKEYSNWPTFPQLYSKGKLVGGNDIVTELFESGELEANL